MAGAAGFAAWHFWPEQGVWNPCAGGLTLPFHRTEFVRSAFAGLDMAKVWDAHVHIVGMGDSPSGIYVNPRMNSLWSPGDYARRVFFMNGGCAYALEGQSVDVAYVRKLLGALDGMRRGHKAVLFAFERAYGEDGKADLEHTTFHVPDGYVRELARENPRYFEWACSIHPYRRDGVEALEQAVADGARAVKWLPSAMGIDPASPRCDAFYAAAARLRIPIVSHAGLARAVVGLDRQDFGNPLRLRRPLEAGVRVVVAHCASMGQDRDTDKGENGPYVDSFELFVRLFDSEKYRNYLFGDISAMPQINRAAPALARVLEREDWHPRLLNGSDYPLPGVMPLFSVDYLISLGLLEVSAKPLLTEIRLRNQLLFDFVLKRHLRSNGKSFAPGVFETRSFFAPAQ